MESLPPGKLIVTQNKTRYKWYVRNSDGLSYLPKNQRPLAESLAKKKYLSLRLKELMQERQALTFYLRHHSKTPCQSAQLLDSPYQELLSPYFAIHSVPSSWTNSSYERNMAYPEQLIHKSISGNMVRSKSESFIDMELYLHKIPFRYECALHLGDITLYPDFTILHPVTGKIYYWEHFGMMDNPNYSKNTFSKLQLYTSFQIIPSIQLITTYETKEHPLSSDQIEQIIQNYFL